MLEEIEDLLAEPDGNGGGEDGPPRRPPDRQMWFAILVIALTLMVAVYDIAQRKVVTVAFKTAHNHYVTAMPESMNWILRAETQKIEAWERFTLLCLCNGKVALKTYHGFYVTATDDFDEATGIRTDWVLMAHTGKRLAWEEFTLFDADTSKQLSCWKVSHRLRRDEEVKIALKTAHNRYVTAMDNKWDWIIRAEAEEIQASEKFTVIPQ